MSKQTTVDAKALEAERLATCLRALAVDARETDGWQDAEADLVAAADFLTALTEQPAPDHAGLADALKPMADYARLRDETVGEEPDDLVVIAFTEGFGRDARSTRITLGDCRKASEAIAALSRVQEPGCLSPTDRARIDKLRDLVEIHGSLEDQVRFDLLVKSVRATPPAPQQGDIAVACAWRVKREPQYCGWDYTENPAVKNIWQGRGETVETLYATPQPAPAPVGCEALRVERDEALRRYDERNRTAIERAGWMARCAAAEAKLKRMEGALAWAENADPLLVEAIRDRALASEESAE